MFYVKVSHTEQQRTVNSEPPGCTRITELQKIIILCLSLDIIKRPDVQ